jgi:F-box-like
MMTPSASSELVKRPASTLVQLPVELLLLILTSLPPESVVAVSLTCKDFFHLIPVGGGVVAGKNAALDKQRLLLLLERDLPDYLLCYTCNKLYRWKRDRIAVSSYRYTCPGRNRDSSHSYFASLCGGCLNGSSLHRETRDLILRAHLRGPDYGLPISYITHECVVRQCYNDLQTPISVKLRPKIVSGSLMLWRTEEIPVNLSISLTEQLHALRACGCHHVSFPLPAIGQCAIRHVLDESNHEAFFSNPPTGGWNCQKLFKCSFCATDLRIDVIIASRKELTIRVATWQDLGSGHDRDSAQDELFKCSPWRPHADDTRLRNLEKFYTDGFRLMAGGGQGDRDTGDKTQQYLIAQDYHWYGWGKEQACLNKLPDF